ncbi:SDR family oxidoreductase [Neobacillus sp. D3-1R]|uniref:SDR family oxidoreductase n=1 Tax=Neobacillus sp. D3-1R TaxID=3445778 RepID=UPI003F9F77C0
MMQKTALITGGATGIGKRIALDLGQQGYNIVLNYRNSKEEAERLVKSLNQFGTKNICVQGDVSVKEDCLRIVKKSLKEFTLIDVVIHNAGPYIYERKETINYTEEEWEYLINGNLNAVFYLSKHFIPLMRKNHWGRLIMIGFDRVDTAPGWIYRSAFAAAKSGLASLTKTLALEEAPYGITVNMVCPGDIVAQWKEKTIDDSKDVKVEENPVGRPGTGEDISRVISFLVEEKSSFITGSVIPVTGAKDVLGKIFK